MPTSSQDYYICPGCGAELLVGSSGCRHCSPRPLRRATSATANPRDDRDDDDFDYEAFIREEFGHPIKPRGIAWIWWVTGVVLLASLVWSLLAGR